MEHTPTETHTEDMRFYSFILFIFGWIVNGFSILVPFIAYKADLNLNLLTANRDFSLPDASGTLTFATSGIRYGQTGTAVLTYTAGTIAGTKDLKIYSGCTINTSGMTWGALLINSGATITLTSALNCSSMVPNGSNSTIVFAGSFGFNVGTLNWNTGGHSLTLVNGVTYNITTSFVSSGTVGSVNTFTCTSGAALLNLQYGASQTVLYTNATRINSAGGQTIYTSVGVLTSTTNWNVGTVPTNQGNFFFLM